MEWVRGAIIGRGSFGTVNLATALSKDNHQTLQLMAVKSSLLSQSSSLQNEKLVLTKLQDCPQILRCFGGDFTTENATRFYNLFLEYVPGGTLADRMKSSGGRLPVSDVRCYTRSILNGLNYIHEKGFVHCDIKLQNLLMASSFDVKIADFGLAKKAGEKSEKGAFLRGTPLYMSPEAVAHGEYESPSDIWSLGCAVVEMITGKPAWKCAADADVSSVLFRIGFGDELPEIPLELSVDGRDFLSKCFVRDPKQRWTAAMLLNHPFVAEEMAIGKETKSAGVDSPSVSPRSAFDFPRWRSLQSSSISACSSSDSYIDSAEKSNQTKDSPSPIDRIGQLATGKRPDWSCWESSWVTTRQEEDCFVCKFDGDATDKKEIQMIESSVSSKSDSLVILQELLMRDGERMEFSNSSNLDAESVDFATSTSSSTADPFDHLISISVPQFRCGSDLEDNIVRVPNYVTEFSSRERDGGIPEQFGSVRCSNLLCKMKDGPDILSGFEGCNQINYSIADEFKHRKFY